VNDRTFLLLVLLAVLLAGFQQWMRHQRRLLVHRERLAAIDKGIELPPVEQEVRRGDWTTRRVLLFAGLLWISVGVPTYLMLVNLIGERPVNAFGVIIEVVDGMQWIGGAMTAIGVSHLIVYAMAGTPRGDRQP
jgi:hypothetical protein